MLIAICKSETESQRSCRYLYPLNPNPQTTRFAKPCQCTFLNNVHYNTILDDTDIMSLPKFLSNMYVFTTFIHERTWCILIEGPGSFRHILIYSSLSFVSMSAKCNLFRHVVKKNLKWGPWPMPRWDFYPGFQVFSIINFDKILIELPHKTFIIYY